MNHMGFAIYPIYSFQLSTSDSNLLSNVLVIFINKVLLFFIRTSFFLLKLEILKISPHKPQMFLKLLLILFFFFKDDETNFSSSTHQIAKSVTWNLKIENYFLQEMKKVAPGGTRIMITKFVILKFYPILRFMLFYPISPSDPFLK